MSRRINDGDYTGLKQDKFRNSRFESDVYDEQSWYYGGVSRSTPNTLGGPFAENRGRRSADSLRSQWDGSPFENQRLSNWKRREGWDEFYSTRDRGNRRYGDHQLNHDGGNFAGLGPIGYRRADQSIYEDVCDALLLTPDVDASEIEVKVENGIVILNGEVADRNTKRLAELEIENISGVRDVQNLLKFKRKQRDLH